MHAHIEYFMRRKRKKKIFVVDMKLFILLIESDFR